MQYKSRKFDKKNKPISRLLRFFSLFNCQRPEVAELGDKVSELESKSIDDEKEESKIES